MTWDPYRLRRTLLHVCTMSSDYLEPAGLSCVSAGFAGRPSCSGFLLDSSRGLRQHNYHVSPRRRSAAHSGGVGCVAHVEERENGRRLVQPPPIYVITGTITFAACAGVDLPLRLRLGPKPVSRERGFWRLRVS